jgi:twitching motility two-component system response regulator PilH
VIPVKSHITAFTINQDKTYMGIFDRLRLIVSKPEAPNLPDIAAGQSEKAIANERRSRPRRNARENTRALIIDDSRTVVAALKKILHSSGYLILKALDAENGLEIARAELPDIIFLDIILPGMNGFAALRALRRDPNIRDIPVIMISGNEQATEQFFGTRIGADDFMKKPFSRFEVFARIERLLDENLVPRRLITAPAKSGQAENSAP